MRDFGVVLANLAKRGLTKCFLKEAALGFSVLV